MFEARCRWGDICVTTDDPLIIFDYTHMRWGYKDLRGGIWGIELYFMMTFNKVSNYYYGIQGMASPNWYNDNGHLR